MQRPQPPWGQDVVEQAPWPLHMWPKLTRARFGEQQPWEAALTFPPYPVLVTYVFNGSRNWEGSDCQRLSLLEDVGLGESQSTWEVPEWS